MLVNKILSKIVFTRPLFIIGIDGPTASGKTYLADNLALSLEKQNIPCFIFRLDWTLIDRRLRENEIDIFENLNLPFEYELDYHMDLSRAEKFLKEITINFKENKKIKLSGLYSREHAGICDGEVEFLMQNKMVVIVEGHYSHHSYLQKYIDYNLVLLSKPEELLRRKIARSASYRNGKSVEEYFRYIDMPSYSHFLLQNHKNISEIFDNTDFDKPVKCGFEELNKFINSEYNYSNSKTYNLNEDFFSGSSLRNKFALNHTHTAIKSLLKFDYKASSVFGIAENMRESSFTDILFNIFENEKFKIQYSDFKPLYSGLVQYFIVLSYNDIRILFFASSDKIRIVLLSSFTKKIYETTRVFSQFSNEVDFDELIFTKIAINIDGNKCLIIPDVAFVSEDKRNEYDNILYSHSDNPILFYENFVKSKFEFLHRFNCQSELKCWFDIFSFMGYQPLQRDNYIYVGDCSTDDDSLIFGYPFSVVLGDISAVLQEFDLKLLSDSGLKYVDQLIVGDISDAAVFTNLFRKSSGEMKILLWQWLIRHYSDYEIFKDVSLKRLYKNLPSQFSDYYFALSLHKNVSVPFFTVFDIRENSIDVDSYFKLSAKCNTAIGIQASQNSLDKESGYLKLNSPEDFSNTICNILINFLEKNPEKNIPLWSLGIDHASAKMNKKEFWTRDFLREVFSQGFVTSVCLDVESYLSNTSIEYAQIENILIEWLSVIPRNTDVELVTGEKLNLLTPEIFEELTKTLNKLLIKHQMDKTVFLLGPALGTAHHAKSDNTSPEVSLKIFQATKHYGSTGNVLHGTSFTKPEEVVAFVKNGCVRVNFAGQYLSRIISSIPNSLAIRFGGDQYAWKLSFAANRGLLENLDNNEHDKIFENIEGLFNEHQKILNNINISSESAKFFHRPVADVPESLIKIISGKCFTTSSFYDNVADNKSVILASMIEVSDDEFVGGLAKVVFNAGIKNFHIDVGDGSFISRQIDGLRKISFLQENFPDVSIHVHIMAESPHLKNKEEMSLIEKYAIKGVNIIYLYRSSFDTEYDFKNAINLIKSLKVKPGIAYNPDSKFSETDFIELEKYDIHNIQLMGVYSGRGGQRFIPEVLKSTSYFRRTAVTRNYELEIEVDGGLTKEIAIQCRNAGATYLSGWSMFLASGKDNIAKTVKTLLNEI